MGQALGAGTLAGACLSMASAPMKLSMANHLLIVTSGAGAGLTIDFASDCFAKTGKVVIHRDVVLQAQDVLRHVYTFYAPCDANRASALIRQKHEWLVLESHRQRFYTVQKSPSTGNIHMDVRSSLRAANDLGLHMAKRPLHTGEVRQHRADMEFDVPNDVPVAYMIAWLRKEEPRWSMTTENSRHFTTKVRDGMNRERIMRRLDLVTGSTNSIVAVGAWCALNAHEANSILDCISERLCSPQTSGAQRVGLIYVIHELLLTCSKKGTPEEAKQLVLVAVSRMLPKVLDTVLDGQFMPSDRSPATEFVLAVEKALEWWGLLKLFSPKWFHTVEAKLRRIPSAAAPSGPDNCTAFITNVQRLSYCLSKYSELKARGSSADARRFLGVLAKEQAREFPDSSAFQQWLQAEWRGLTGSEVKQEADPHRGLPSAPGQAEEHHLLSPERTRIKMEAPDRFASGSSGLVSGGANSSSNSGMMGDALAMSASSAAVKPDDSNKKSGDEEEENDILGSFFD